MTLNIGPAGSLKVHDDARPEADQSHRDTARAETRTVAAPPARARPASMMVSALLTGLALAASAPGTSDRGAHAEARVSATITHGITIGAIRPPRAQGTIEIAPRAPRPCDAREDGATPACQLIVYDLP